LEKGPGGRERYVGDWMDVMMEGWGREILIARAGYTDDI
jgi:hypothetical protein